MGLRHFLRSEDGATAVYFALVSPVLIGFAALGAEATLWLATERKLQQIADVSAYSGAASSLSTPNGEVGIRASAESIARASGLADTDVISIPRAEPDWVEVRISRALPRYLSILFAKEEGPVTIAVRAVAEVDRTSGQKICMLSLGDFRASGSGDLVVKNCGLAANSPIGESFKMEGRKVSVAGSCLYTVGGVSSSGNLSLECGAPLTQQRPSLDPFARLPFESLNRALDTMPSLTGKINVNGKEIQTTIYKGGVTLSNQTLDPGIYVVDGGTLKINAQANVKNLVGGVSFYLRNGAKLDVSGGAQLDISAYDLTNQNHRPDDFNGLLFFSDPGRSGSAVSHRLAGNSGSSMKGVVYFPKDEIVFTGSSGTIKPCIEVIAQKITVDGSGGIELGCDELQRYRPATLPFITAQDIIRLVE